MGGGGETRTIEQLNENLSLSVPTKYDADCSSKTNVAFTEIFEPALTG